jgi:hypothetical protein
MSRTSILVMAVLLSGCTVKPFQPSLDLFARWEKPGVDRIGTQKALMECGSVTPLGRMDALSGPLPEPSEDRRIAATLEKCMQSDGFKLVPRADSDCDPHFRPNPPAICRPDNAHLVPRRDVKRRLTSEFCTDRSDLWKQYRYPRPFYEWDVCKP